MPPISRILPIQTARAKNLLLLFFSTLLMFHLYFLLQYPRNILPPPVFSTPETPVNTPSDLFFSICSSSASLHHRAPFIHLWYSPNSTPHTYIFVDRPVLISTTDPPLPPVIVSSDTAQFPYTFPRGNRAAIRIAHVVKDVFTLLNPPPHIRWFIFGDDDTVFFRRNLALVLSKYDHNKWFYIGSVSESYEQNMKFSFDMAFGGGGFALSAPLAKALAGVLDSCLLRYPHLYGSDARIFACLAELGVELTREPGFHQIDVRGDLFGLLAAHPLSPMVSLHHIDAVEPIFPGMSRIQALEHLFKAVHVDPPMIFQQTVCYDPSNLLTVSVSGGYVVQVFEGNQLLPNLLLLQRTFRSWRRAKNVYSSLFMFNTREVPTDLCKKPLLFFLHSVRSDTNRVWTNYTKHNGGSCTRSNAIQRLKNIRVFSRVLEYDIEQMKAPRRRCCDVVSPVNETMTVEIRKCMVDESISIHG